VKIAADVKEMSIIQTSMHVIVQLVTEEIDANKVIINHLATFTLRVKVMHCSLVKELISELESLYTRDWFPNLGVLFNWSSMT
jgi:hypothetical protein